MQLNQTKPNLNSKQKSQKIFQKNLKKSWEKKFKQFKFQAEHYNI